MTSRTAMVLGITYSMDLKKSSAINGTDGKNKNYSKIAKVME